MSAIADNEQQEHTGGSMMWIALRISLLFIILCGVIYPLVSTGAAQLLFPDKANGSLVKDGEGNIIGSELIGQSFTKPSYFQGRVSSIDYKAEASGSNNYAPTNPDMLARLQVSIDQWQKENPDVPIADLPIALITNSGSGLDPDITPQSALVQIPRISKLTGIPSTELEALVEDNIKNRELGIFGDKRINVLKLNLALSEKLEK